VTTGFECDVECRALGARSRLVERKNFCVGFAWTTMVSPAHNAAVFHHEGADHGVRAGLAPALRRKTKGQGHEVTVRDGGGHLVLRVTRDRLRGC
jgi:hypothetical protein